MAVEVALVAFHYASVNTRCACKLRLDRELLSRRVHLSSEPCLLVAYGAERLAIAVQAALVTQLEVARKDEFLVGVQIDHPLNVSFTEKGLRAAF